MHGGLINLTQAQRSGFGVSANDRVLQFASQACDAAVSEIVVTLLAGAALVLASPQAKGDANVLAEWQAASSSPPV